MYTDICVHSICVHIHMYVYLYVDMFEYNIVDRYMVEISKSCKLFFGLLSINS